MGESGVTRLGVRGFQLLEPAHHAVVLGVRDLRPVQDVIQILVMVQLFAEIFDLFFDIPVHNLIGGHRL